MKMTDEQEIAIACEDIDRAVRVIEHAKVRLKLVAENLRRERGEIELLVSAAERVADGSVRIGPREFGKLGDGPVLQRAIGKEFAHTGLAAHNIGWQRGPEAAAESDRLDRLTNIAAELYGDLPGDADMPQLRPTTVLRGQRGSGDADPYGDIPSDVGIDK